MSYLVRRLLENTSNEGFLRAKFSEHISATQLLRDPRELVNGVVPAAGREGLAGDTPASTGVSDFSRNGATLETPPGDTYKNASLVNFVYPECQEKMRTALREVRARFGQKHPLVIDGKEIWTDKLLKSVNPSAPDEIIGYVAEAGIPETERAVKAARRAFETWARTPVEERCQLLERAAAILDRRRFELSAVEVFEVGKAWAEADGDIREAMDFCLFYAHQMRLIGYPRLTQNVPGEESYQHYWPRGVALVIAPWNFPVAILCGMVTAALVTGNAVIMKPAEPSAILGSLLMEDFPGSRRSTGSFELSTRSRFCHRRIPGRSSRRRNDRIYRLTRSRSANLGVGGQNPPGPARTQARRLRDGREERSHCRFRRRSR